MVRDAAAPTLSRGRHGVPGLRNISRRPRPSRLIGEHRTVLLRVHHRQRHPLVIKQSLEAVLTIQDHLDAVEGSTRVFAENYVSEIERDLV